MPLCMPTSDFYSAEGVDNPGQHYYRMEEKNHLCGGPCRGQSYIMWVHEASMVDFRTIPIVGQYSPLLVSDSYMGVFI
jgi:hypothetical protein